MHSHNVLHPTPVRNLKRTLTHLEICSKSSSKRIRLSSDHLPTPPSSTPDGHSDQSNTLFEALNWRERLKSSLLRPLENPPSAKQLKINPELSAWLETVPFPRADSCPALLSQPGFAVPRRPQSCEAHFEIVGYKQPESGSDPKSKRARLTLAALQKMSHGQLQRPESQVPRSNSSSNKAPGTSDAMYIDTLYGHGIVMDLSGRKIPKELAQLKERILQRRNSPQLDEKAVLTVMDVAEELAYNSEGPTDKILRTPMFPLEYGGLVEGGGTKWNTVGMPNNLQCNNKLSAPKPDAYLAYPRGSKSPWTVEQNNVVNHPRIRPYSQPGKRNTFPSLSFELKAESAGGVLTTAEAQAAGSGSHSVNSILWLLEEAKAAGLTEVDLMQDTVSFSVVSSHRQAVAYLHWLDPSERHFYMSYLRSYSTFEADDIRGCNNTIKNIIDNATGPRKIKIGKALVSLEPVLDTWNPQPTVNTSLSGNPKPRKRPASGDQIGEESVDAAD